MCNDFDILLIGIFDNWSLDAAAVVAVIAKQKETSRDNMTVEKTETETETETEM